VEESIELIFKDSKGGSSLADKLLDLLAKGPMSTSQFYPHIREKGNDIGAELENLERKGLVTREERQGEKGRAGVWWSRTDTGVKQIK
jgi:hypothetical protein